MKSIKKLISFNNHKSKEKRDSSLSHESLDSKLTIELEEDAKDLKDLSEMQKQYEGLCAVSSLVSSRAREFSSTINDLAEYFINTFGAIEDGELSKVFKIVGRVQFEVSKNLDAYAAHVAQTITEPTESLLLELRNVQDSKTQHDEKRQLYEQLRSRMLKGKPKHGKGDTFADQQLQVVKDEFDKLSLFIDTRLDSLEKGKARSLITQAARHHTAQMQLFSRGHSSLQAVEPYMRQVARERSIDRHLSIGMSGVNEMDDASDAKSDDDVSYIEELDDSSDLEQSNRWGSRVHSPGRSPTHVDQELEVPKNLSKEWNSLLTKLNHTSGENPHLRNGDNLVSTSSQSAKQDQNGAREPEKGSRGRATPVSHYPKPSENDSIQVTEVTDEPVSSQGLNKPSSPLIRMPHDTLAGMTRGSDAAVSRNLSDLSSSVSTSGRTSVDLHPFDVDPIRESSGYTVKPNHSPISSSESFQAKLLASAQKLQGSTGMGNPPILSFVSPMISPTPAGYATNMEDASVSLKRYSQSGPLTFSGTPWSGQTSTGNPVSSKGQSAHASDVHKSGPLGRSPLGRTFGSPRISPSMSPPRMSPPRISELHKLPPPPLNPSNTRSKSPRLSSIVTHSAPLSRRTDSFGSRSVKATPLPPPPLGSVPRSLSLPSRQRQQRSKITAISHLPEVDEEGSPSSSATNSSTSPRLNGNNFLSQAYGLHKRGQSGNVLDQESGPSSELKFVHFNSAKSTERSPPFSSHHRRPPSPPIRKDKLRQSEGHQGDPGSMVIAPLKSGSVQNSPSWRSLSINDKDNYVQSIARAVAIEREC